MRDNFWKWLKRFFIVLPIIVLLINLSIFVLRQNGENLQYQDQSTMYNEDFVGTYIYYGMDGGYDDTPFLAYNPLFAFTEFNYNTNVLYENSLMYNINQCFNRLMTYFVGENSYDTTSVYVPMISNFFTWWVFVELIFLFFRFVTFLISWVNSLFDNTFKKIKR